MNFPTLRVTITGPRNDRTGVLEQSIPKCKMCRDTGDPVGRALGLANGTRERTKWHLEGIISQDMLCVD
jgi:hypothetical protein